ncbi:hypothetical protein KJ840_03300, partial [Patescibacteria group bacterium]|nr:hypothetical protein [Patescibacteria group bacterium]
KKKKFENFLKQLGDSPKKKRNISANVPAYAMFASGIIARSAYHWQIWVEACGGTEQAVTAYAVLYDVHVFL